MQTIKSLDIKNLVDASSFDNFKIIIIILRIDRSVSLNIMNRSTSWAKNNTIFCFYFNSLIYYYYYYYCVLITQFVLLFYL
jgi:hypothetical protein